MIKTTKLGIAGGILSALFLLTGIKVADDNYKVIHVQGKIIAMETMKPLVRGEVIAVNQEFNFATASSRAAVINPVKGRMILAPSPDKESKSNLRPAMHNISSRSGGLLNLMDMQNQFKGKYVVFSPLSLEIGKEAFPLTDSSFFFLRYKYKGEDINKKLPFGESNIVIDQEQLFTVDDQRISAPDNYGMKLYYMVGNRSTLISEFTVIFPDQNDLKEELQIIMESIAGKTEEEKIAEVTAHINEFYGKPQKENLQKWMEANLH